MNHALFSLVTVTDVTRNTEEPIEQTLASIHSQNYPYLEHLVIDSNSSDLTYKIIRAYKDCITHFISM